MIFTPLGWLFRGCGISPTESRSDKFYSFIILCFVVFISLSYYQNTRFDSILEVLNASSLIIGLGGVVGIVLYNLCCSHDYPSITQDLSKIDEELQNYGFLQNQPIKTQKVLFYGLIINGLVQSLILLADNKTLLTTTIMLAFQLILDSPFLQHLTIVGLLHSKFSALNNQLTDLAAKVKDIPLKSASSRLDNVFRLHSSLHVIVMDVNSHYWFYLLLNFTSMMFFFVLRMYDYLLSIGGTKSVLTTEIVCEFIFEIFFFVIHSASCHACAKEANRTALLAHHVLQPDTPVVLWDQVGLFSRLAIGNKVQFTVGGIFTIDRPLLTQSFVAALSYLIVAVQLKDVRLSGEVALNTTTTTDFINSTT